MDSEEQPNTNFINCSDYTKQLNTLLDMGFEKEKAYKAIKIARGKIELAIDFLYNGFPINLSNIDKGSMDENNGDDEDEYGEDFEDIGFLLEKISAIFKLISQEKKIPTDELMSNLQKNNFKLFQFIKENEDQFKSFLIKPITENDILIFRGFRNGSDDFGIYNLKLKDFEVNTNNNQEKKENNDDHYKQEDNKINDIGNDIDEQEYDVIDNENEDININENLDEEEKKTINRLKDLGNFKEGEVIQAFVACDRNEELTANYLFEHISNNINNINDNA